MTAPLLDRSCAAAVLALISAARVHAPGSEIAWLMGWAMRASGEPVHAPERPVSPDPRREPEEGAVLGRVPLAPRRPQPA